ncbi:hypothetical protein M3Y97_00949500 [Aphelenchoides bicaudatus]|nr:hypothetical protein M3Y97_00949500 [Aphelenchoides bicaudatus]
MIGKFGFFMLFLTVVVVLQVFVEETEAASSPTSLETACADGGNADCKETCQETKSKKTNKCFCTGACNGSKCKCSKPTCKCQIEKDDDAQDGPDDDQEDD